MSLTCGCVLSSAAACPPANDAAGKLPTQQRSPAAKMRTLMIFGSRIRTPLHAFKSIDRFSIRHSGYIIF